MKIRLPILLVILILLCMVSVGLYYLPPIHSRLAWRIDDLRARVREVFSPPESIEFISSEAMAEANPSALPVSTTTPIPTNTPVPTQTAPEDTPLPTFTPTLTPTPLPASISLTSDTFRYMHQHGAYNYCAPATLGMALSFWGWEGDRTDTGKVVKPYPKDLNVMPYEMEDFAETQARLGAITRVGGDSDLIKRLVAAGLPVLVEKGVYFRDLSGVVSWMGHYQLVTGYDDGKGIFITQDSYVEPGENHPEPYDTFLSNWRSFNYTYIVLYPPEREAEVLAVLGPHADETYNLQYAANLASEEVYSGLTGVDLLFAWYNRGTNLVKLQDYGGAATAYDQAFSIYNTLPEDKSVRPYRILWYQTGPYYAYYYTGRYYTVIDLADSSLEAVFYDDTSPEESLYWRGMAKLALGDNSGAIADFRESIDPYHPGFEPSVYQLTQLGVEP
ncbi:MAG: hypothetical protein EHM41_10830 [Chloroflexi bacterium]|nr:MAG: hypothetical protein EHM41_10830 [Chloroflexota bacterium]